MKNLIFTLLVALLGGATNLFAQISWEDFGVEVIDEEWQCINVSESDDNGGHVSMIETPYGTLLYGKFAEINGVLYSNTAIYKDYKIEPTPFTGEFQEVFSVTVKENEVIMVTNIGIYSWFGGGNELIPWGVDIDMNTSNATEEFIVSKIRSNRLLISGDIQFINGEAGFGAVINLGDKGIEKILEKTGFIGTDIDILLDTIWAGYTPSDEAVAIDGISIMAYDLSSGQEVSPNLPIGLTGVGSTLTIEDTLYIVYTDFLEIETKMMKFDGSTWVTLGKAYGKIYEVDGEIYSSPGPIKWTGAGWSFLIGTDSLIGFGEKNFFIEGHWYSITQPGSGVSAYEYADGEEYLQCTDMFIAKLGEPEIEVSIEETEEEVTSDFDLQIFFSGESLIVKSNLTESSMLEVYDLTGKIVLAESVLPGTNIFNFPHHAGLYIANKTKFMKL